MGAANEVVKDWIEEITADWEQIRSWSERVFTNESIADTILLLFSVTLWAVLLFYLYTAFQNRAIVYISPYLSSLKYQLPTAGF